MPHRLWHWDYFVKREEDKLPSEQIDFYGTSKVYYNTWCKACIDHKVHELEQQDKVAKVQGHVSHIRSSTELKNAAMDSIKPLPNRRERLDAHIRACHLIPQSAKDRLSSEDMSHAALGVAELTLTDSTNAHNRNVALGLGACMPSQDQERFESDLCKLWVALGIPWHGINHPQAHIFFQKWQPNAKLPDRHKLSGPILQREVNSARESMRKQIEGRIAIGMSDGWKNIRRNSLLASLLSVDYKTYTVNVHDLSAQRKTADNHLKLVLSDIDYAEDQYKVRVIAWVSDAGGESRAMRVRLNRIRPHILVFDCWAHQINLVVGDILKLESELVEAAEQAINIIRWLLNHSYLLGLFHKEQLRLTGTTRTLSLPVITRWTSHFLSFTSLITEARPLRSLVMFHPESVLASAGRSPEQLQEAKDIIQTIEDSSFWQKLTALKIYLEPLAIAANVAQAPTTRLDHILIELGRLYYTFSRFAMDPKVSACALNSLGLRWIKCDQDPPIVSVVLNPYVRTGAFNQKNTLLNRTSLYGAAKRVFRRLFRKDSDLGMHEAFMDYLDGINEFHPDRWDFQELRALYEQAGKPINLVRVWSGLLTSNTSNTGRQQLVHLAINVLSIVANSAGCERLFSEMGYIQSKRRSRLSNEKTFDTAVVRMELKREHAAAALTRSRLRRQFGIPASNLEPSPSLPHAETDDQHDEMGEELAEIDALTEDSTTYSIKELARNLAQDVIDDEDPPDDDLDANNAINDPQLGTNLPTESMQRPKHLRLFFGTQHPIPLEDIFNYDAPDIEGVGLNIFRKTGLSNLQKELEAYDLLTRDIQIPFIANEPDD